LVDLNMLIWRWQYYRVYWWFNWKWWLWWLNWRYWLYRWYWYWSNGWPPLPLPHTNKALMRIRVSGKMSKRIKV
ncbi:hypothetical protein M1N06_05485, partial [Peptococcaceae bacterium]|nr:hypothetical protein [Peptococcaceae bacterium]